MNGSYTVSTSTSAGSSPAILNAGGAANTCGVDVNARCWLQWPPDSAVPSPTPATTAGGRRRSRARSIDVVTNAAPPSEIKHESNMRSGSASFGEAR